MLWIIKQKRNEISCLAAVLVLKIGFWDKNASISHIFLQYQTYFLENKAYKSNFFYIELKQKCLKIINTDGKEKKNIKK